MTRPSNHAPVAMSHRELRDVPAGTQPHSGEWLSCLECGVWMRFLTNHVRAKHDLSGSSYRARHELAPRTPLISASLSAARAERGRRSYPLVADKFQNRTARSRRKALRRSIATRREAAGRAGTQANLREVMARRAEATRAKAEAHLDENARAAGYQDLADLFARNENRRLADIGQLLGISDRYASELHRRFYPRTGRRRPVRDPGTDAAGYARRSEGVREKHRAIWDRAAQQAGYPNMVEALQRTAELRAVERAAVLGVSRSMIYYMARELC